MWQRALSVGGGEEKVFTLHKANTSDMTTAQNLVFDCGFTPKYIYAYGLYTPASKYICALYDADNLGASKQLYAQGNTSYLLDLKNLAEGGALRIESISGSTVTLYYVGTYFTNLTVVAVG